MAQQDPVCCFNELLELNSRSVDVSNVVVVNHPKEIVLPTSAEMAGDWRGAIDSDRCKNALLSSDIFAFPSTTETTDEEEGCFAVRAFLYLPDLPLPNRREI